MLNPTVKAQAQIHLCVVLWGFTAILGRLISLSALPLVWWRMLIVVTVLALLPRTWRGARAMSSRLRWAYAGIGLIVALHWLTFYGSIKLANASVAATCIALCPVFLSVVEPLLMRRPFEARELLIGAAVVPGVALVVGGMPHGMRLGLIVGVVSALLVAFFGALNKRFVEHGDPLAVTAIELGAGVVLVTLAAWLVPHSGPAFPVPGRRDAILLLTLATACTLLPFTLSLVALRHLSAFGAQLAVNLEPVYSILLAIPLLGERRELEASFYLGVVVILGVVLAYPFVARRPQAIEMESGALVQEYGEPGG